MNPLAYLVPMVFLSVGFVAYDRERSAGGGRFKCSIYRRQAERPGGRREQSGRVRRPRQQEGEYG